MSGKINWVDHDGLKFRVSVSCAGDDKPWVAFSNSVLTDLTIWDAQAALLEGRYNILRYDQRGHGQTSVPPGPCDFHQLGGDLLALLDHHGIERATLVGLSMGAPTVLDVVDRAPERVERLVISDGQSGTAPGGRETWQGRIDMARAKGMKIIADDMAARWFGEDFRRTGGHLKALDVAARVPLEGYVACVRALQDYGYHHVLAKIAVPTLLLVGAHDGNMPNSMRALRDSIDGARLEIVANAGHVPGYEQPEAYNRYLDTFLRDTDPLLGAHKASRLG